MTRPAHMRSREALRIAIEVIGSGREITPEMAERVSFRLNEILVQQGVPEGNRLIDLPEFCDVCIDG